MPCHVNGAIEYLLIREFVWDIIIYGYDLDNQSNQFRLLLSERERSYIADAAATSDKYTLGYIKRRKQDNVYNVYRPSITPCQAQDQPLGNRSGQQSLIFNWLIFNLCL